jgi:FSR family fosmidomycin resistance protein-like MFS transporter
MSVFAVGGNLGFALAPLVTAALVVGLGRAGTLLVLLPTGLIAVLLAGQFSGAPAAGPSLRKKPKHVGQRDDGWAGFVVLSLVTICRSIFFVGMNTFLALWWMSRWSMSASAGTTMLGVYLGASLCGTLLGGRLADRFGRRTVLLTGFGTAGLLLPLLLLTSEPLWGTVVLILLAIAFNTPSGLLVLLGQDYLPNRIGVASGVTLGLAVSVGGMMAPVLGWFADLQGIDSVMLVLEGALVASVLLGLLLPQPPGRLS